MWKLILILFCILISIRQSEATLPRCSVAIAAATFTKRILHSALNLFKAPDLKENKNKIELRRAEERPSRISTKIWSSRPHLQVNLSESPSLLFYSGPQVKLKDIQDRDYRYYYNSEAKMGIVYSPSGISHGTIFSDCLTDSHNSLGGLRWAGGILKHSLQYGLSLEDYENYFNISIEK